MKHAFRMLLGCGLALLAAFLLPALGAGNGLTFAVFFILMIGCHLFMGHGHGSHGDRETGQPPGGSAIKPGHAKGEHE